MNTEISGLPALGAALAGKWKKPEYKREELLVSGMALVEGMPQLPLPPMLMFDTLSISETGGDFGKGIIRAELTIDPELWFFKCHFKGKPVMPGCLELDALWQMLGFFLGWVKAYPGEGFALGVSDLKLTGKILPTATLVVFEVHPKKLINTKGSFVGIGNGKVIRDGETICTAEHLRVMVAPFASPPT